MNTKQTLALLEAIQIITEQDQTRAADNIERIKEAIKKESAHDEGVNARTPNK